MIDVYKRQGMGEEDKTWNAVIRQALIAGYLSKDVEHYGLLKVTEEGHKFLKKPKSFKITEDNDFEEVEEEVPARGGGSCAVDPALYSMLKEMCIRDRYAPVMPCPLLLISRMDGIFDL